MSCGEEQAIHERRKILVRICPALQWRNADHRRYLIYQISAPAFRGMEDESLRRWKEQLLGCVDYSLHEDFIEPEVTALSLGVISNGSPKITIPLPLAEGSNQIHFTLKEASTFSLKFTFIVCHNIVSGLACVTTIWKHGLLVDQTRCMLGTFGPRQEPYIYISEEDTTPNGILACGTYKAKTKFVDDDGRCHLELDYSFSIQKDC